MAAVASRMPQVRPRARTGQTLAVALHGIEPATFERCAVMRDWLADHGVDRVTLLVIPARDLHPVGSRCPDMIEWLYERRGAGDSIAQHGFQHVRAHGPGTARQLIARARGRRNGEFVGLDQEETRRAVHAGWRVLKLAGVEPDGFVAPAYAYTPALRQTLSLRFRWWASLMRVHRAPQRLALSVATGAYPYPRAEATADRGEEVIAGSLAPAWSLAANGPVSRAFSPALVRAGSLLPTDTLRLDLHPSDLTHTRHMLALEWVLARAASRRTAITYRELAGV
jgi:predicted deacetylase